MHLEGQLARRDERGYAMAALLVAIAVMSVLMSAAIPAWRHQAKREKEAELIFRGEQYVRAISLWERKMGPGSRPPNFDILVEQRFLRKKYKDPITGEDFQPLYMGMNMPAPVPGRGRGRGGRGGPEPPAPQTPAAFQGPRVVRTFPGPGQQAVGGGIIGVVSKSTERSIRIYNGGTFYNQWLFRHAGAAQTPGGPGSVLPGGGGRATRPGLPPGRGGRGVPMGPGRRGVGPGGRGMPPPPPPPPMPSGGGRGPGGQ